MHVWQATFHVGDFGRKTLTVTTQDRAASYPDSPDEAGQFLPSGGFAEAEVKALAAARQETSGWPAPIELVGLQYVDEIEVKSEKSGVRRNT